MINEMENQSKCTSSRKFTFNGICYNNCSECCKILGINYGSVRTRVYELKCSKEEAIQHFLDAKENKKFIFNGVEYNSYFDCCRILDVNYSNVKERISLFNCTRQEAIEYFLSNPVPKMNRKFVFNGVEYESFKKCCSAYGINHFNVATRASRVNYSKEEALQYYLNKTNNKKFIFNGIEYNSFSECCESLGINCGSVYTRCYNTKCTKEEAIQHFLDIKK